MSTEILQTKIDWMLSHVEVDFPTRESLLGRAVYQDLMESSSVKAFHPSDGPAPNLEWMKVDFHKMTVMFAHFFAHNAKVPEDSQTVLLEFMAQIILDDNPSLWLAFKQGEIVTTAITTESETELLISDFLSEFTPVGSIDELVNLLNPLKKQVYVQGL